MELSNFASIYCFITFIMGAVFMFIAVCVVAISKIKEPRNNVHFYVARDKSGCLYLHIEKPFRDGLEFSNNLEMYYRLQDDNFKYFGLNENDFTNLKWEDEPIEVFINLKD